jgi:hypothetical protein
VLSALVAAACVLASARRLTFAVLPTWLDSKLLVQALRGERVGVPSPPGRTHGDWVRLRDAIAGCRDATWEHDLLAALEPPDERSRVALVNEQLREFDWRARRWARVPRVCASVATSAGFLFACVALMRALSLPTGDASAGLVPALNALAIGIAGTSFCVAAHLLARRVVIERLASAERFVEVLESCT